MPTIPAVLLRGALLIQALAWRPAAAAPEPAQFAFEVAIAHEPGVTRRDPSDVIRVAGIHHVWYSKVRSGPGVFEYPSGYSAEVWHATSRDGHAWTERGRAVVKGGADAWDGHGVFTPNILIFGGRFHLYYTGVAAGHGATTATQIGVAVADSPAGPWRKFGGNPVLSPGAEPLQFDSMRVDDAALLVRDGRVWLYYKGRQRDKSPGETRMGLAFADLPTGPFARHGRPLHAGHEVMIWPEERGVASLASAAGPRMIYFAADGLHFAPRQAVRNPPAAPGVLRGDQSGDNAGAGGGPRWGLAHAAREGDLFLQRFDWVAP